MDRDELWWCGSRCGTASGTRDITAGGTTAEEIVKTKCKKKKARTRGSAPFASPVAVHPQNRFWGAGSEPTGAKPRAHGRRIPPAHRKRRPQSGEFHPGRTTAR